MTNYEAVLMRHMKSETPFISESDSPFCVQSYYVDFSRIPSLEIPTSIIKFSEEQYAIPHSKCIKLATPSHFREIEEEVSNGIGDSMEATYKRETDLATIQKESGQKLMWGAELVSVTMTQVVECWIFCASIEPKPKTSWEIKKLRDSLDENYDCCTSITNPSEFAKQLGISFGNSFKSEWVNHPGPSMWLLMPHVFVNHGPVIYADQGSKEIERFPQNMQSLVTPFIKRSKFSNQQEYRIVIWLMSNPKPKEETLFLNVTDELRRLTQAVELSTFDGLGMVDALRLHG